MYRGFARQEMQSSASLRTIAYAKCNDTIGRFLHPVVSASVIQTGRWLTRRPRAVGKSLVGDRIPIVSGGGRERERERVNFLTDHVADKADFL